LSALTILFVTNILFIASSIIAYQVNGQEPAGLGKLVWASCSLLFTQLVFMSFGIVFATFARKVRSVSGIATAFGFAGFILTALRSLIDEEAIRFVAPLKYFDPAVVFSNGGYEAKYVVTAAVVTAACLCVSYVKFTKSDTPAL
jgi:ABC-2 type transport system permease protein